MNPPLTPDDWKSILDGKLAWSPEHTSIIEGFQMFQGRLHPTGHAQVKKFLAINRIFRKRNLPYRIQLDRSTQRFPIRQRYYYIRKTP
jgi:hypothetical protein